jgi:hypothetical protein
MLTEYVLLIGFILLAILGGAAGYGKSIAGFANSLNSNLAIGAISASSGACRQESNCEHVQTRTADHKVWFSFK